MNSKNIVERSFLAGYCSIVFITNVDSDRREKRVKENTTKAGYVMNDGSENLSRYTPTHIHISSKKFLQIADNCMFLLSCWFAFLSFGLCRVNRQHE